MASDSSVLFVSLFSLVFSQVVINEIKAVKYTDCNSGKQTDALPESVMVSGCENQQVCSLVRGTNASIEVKFKTTKPFNSALVEIYGKIYGRIPIPFRIKPDNACGNYGFDCPVAENQEENLKIAMLIRQSYPKIPVTIQLYLSDEKKRPIICVEFPAKIVDA